MRAWWTVLAVLLTACVLVTEPEYPVQPINPQRFEPPALFTEWAAELLECAGADASQAHRLVTEVHWYRVDGFIDERTVLSFGGQETTGLRREVDGRSVIYLRADRVGVSWAVKHEMNHHRIDDPKHADQSWSCARP